MKISEIISRNVTLASPDETIQEAAQKMRDIDAGSLTEGEGDRLVGMVTDRDLASRSPDRRNVAAAMSAVSSNRQG